MNSFKPLIDIATGSDENGRVVIINSITELVNFYKEADFTAFDEMMNHVLPHSGQEYRRGKFGKFKRDFSGWLCDLTTNNQMKFELYLISKKTEAGASELDPSTPASLTDELN